MPATATAAALNLTVTNPHDVGFLTAWPCGQPLPNTSNLNFVAGETVANFAAVNIGAGGRICVTSPVTTQVIVDVTGYWGPGGLGFGAVLPTRLIDTRPARYGLGHITQVQVTGKAGIPATAQAAAINLTATGTGGPGWFTVWPCGQPQPNTSNVNFVAGQSVANVAAVAARDGRHDLHRDLDDRVDHRRRDRLVGAGRARVRATRRVVGPAARHPPDAAWPPGASSRCRCPPASPSPR